MHRLHGGAGPQPPRCSGRYLGGRSHPCPVRLCWGQGIGPQATCIHRHIPIMSYPIAHGQHPQPCAQPGEPCTLLPASLPACIPPCPHPSLPAQRAAACRSMPSIAQPHANSSPGTAGLHIPPAAICSGDSPAHPRAAGEDAGRVGAQASDVSGRGYGTCQGTAAG